jgi:ribosomal-protein-alanine N-acetyltransferase
MDVKIDIANTRIETDRLLLRAWEETDLNDFYEYASVEGVGEMAGWPHHKSIDTTRMILQSFLSGKNVFAVALKESGKVIGSLGLHSSWTNDEPELSHLKAKAIGYVLSKDYWGQGLIPEAVKTVIGFCFDKCGLDAVSIGHFVSNNQSRRVIEKCGFQYVKTSQYYTKQLQKTFDDMKYILLRETTG